MLPPLRDRRADIPELARRILEEFDRVNGGHHTFQDDAIAYLLSCDFPGNIRELENYVKRAAVMAGGATITASDFTCQQRMNAASGSCMAPPIRPKQLAITSDEGTSEPSHPAAPADVSSTVDDATDNMPQLARGSGLLVSRDQLVDALTTTGWSQAKAGRLLGLSARQIAYAIRRLDVSIQRF